MLTTKQLSRITGSAFTIQRVTLFSAPGNVAVNVYRHAHGADASLSQCADPALEDSAPGIVAFFKCLGINDDASQLGPGGRRIPGNSSNVCLRP